MRNTLILAAAIAIGAAFYFSSCSNESPVIPNSGINTSDTVFIGNGNGTNCAVLYAGQTINAGTVCFIDVDTDNNGYDDVLRVCYNTTDGWELTEVHLFVGSSLVDMPMTKSGNPIPGQFPYSSGVITGQTSYCIDIPFTALQMTCPGGPFNKVFAAHASVRKLVNGVWQTETGWADGPRITTRGSWAEYNTFTLYCDAPPVQPCNETETSFAYGGTANAHCFNEYGFVLNNSNRWGWTNGPLAPSATAYTFDIYAGAGQCDLGKGFLAGTLTVLYQNGTATVTWNLLAAHKAKEFHLFIGAEPLPRNNQNEYTIAPGQFGNTYTVPTGSLQTYTFTINNLSGNIYVMAHAVVEDCQ